MCGCASVRVCMCAGLKFQLLTTNLCARRKRRKRLASLEDGHLEDVLADVAVSRRARIEAVAQRKQTQLRKRHDGGKIVLKVRARHA